MTGKKTFATAVAALLVGLTASGAALAEGPAQAQGKAKTRGAHYVFRGHLTSASTSAVSLTVEGGNRIALKKLLGASVDQTFAVGPRTEFLSGRTASRPSCTPATSPPATGSSSTSARRGARRSPTIESHAAGIVVGSRREAEPAREAALPLPRQARRGGRLELGRAERHRRQPPRAAAAARPAASQTFTYGPETIFLRLAGQGADRDRRRRS